MPNRIVRENILSSEAVCSLKWDEEVFYRRLMSIVDDYGRFEGRPELIRTKCYPLQVDQVRVADITRWNAACVKAGLILNYSVDGRQYIQILKFGQPLRSKSKYPDPDHNCMQMISNDFIRKPITDTDSDTDSDTKKGCGEKEKLEVRFIRFWDKYPKKEGKDGAMKTFIKIKPDDPLLDRMLNAIELQRVLKKWDLKENYQFIPLPQTWLNGKRWEDDHSGSLQVTRRMPSSADLQQSI
jgi:hypothetical protein